MPLVEEVPTSRDVALDGQVSVRFRDAGHILGSAMIELTVRENGEARTIVFSGDIGQWDKPFVAIPRSSTAPTMSSWNRPTPTVTTRTRGRIDELLAGIVRETAAAGGNVVIPTFAIERAQELMFYLSRLVYDKAIPPLPVYLDSPMAREVTEAFERHSEFLDEESRRALRIGPEEPLPISPA